MVGMDAFVTHLDEELINGRYGRRYGQKYGFLNPASSLYTPEELAFWLNFYGLFYEHLYVPPNYLTDSRWTLEVLKALGGEDPHSLIRSSASPLRVYWEEDRWPFPFTAMVQRDWSGDESVTAQTSCEEALAVAAWCDANLVGREKIKIRKGTVDVRNSLTHSLQRLENDIFTDNANSARLHTPMPVLREFVQLLANAPLGEVGYGRNLVYTLFGYHRRDWPVRQRQLNDVLKAPIAQLEGRFPHFRHEFLMGLDLVSHELKAVRAGRIAGSRLRLLMPPDYYDGFHPPAYDAGLAELGTERSEWSYIDPLAILRLTPHQFEFIKDSSEAEAFQASWLRLESARAPGANVISETEQALADYLRHIATVLHPVTRRVNRFLQWVGSCAPVVGSATGFLLQVKLGGPAFPFPGTVVGAAVGLGISKAIGPLQRCLRPATQLGVSQVHLSEGVTVYMAERPRGRG